ncbi:Putative peptide/nitrate transporter [Glycine soja]|nr:Putative peptide/nitrate transporter [Glycine soja]
MEKRKQGKSEGNEKQKWVHDASVDYKGRVPIRASTEISIGRDSNSYRRLQGNPFMPILQVLIAAIRKRNLLCPSNPASMSENFQGRLLSHTSRLRFLDNAAIVEENNIEQKDSQWRSATVTRLEETKLILNVIPIWLTSLVVGVCTANHTIKQAAAMNLKINNSFKIPPASMESVSAFGTIICPNI